MSGIQLSAEKTCTHCKASKPRDAFASNASNADGLQRHCRECMRTMRARGPDKAQAPAAPAGSVLASMPLNAIVASLTNPRRHFHPARLAELAESIKASGVHQPVLVRPLPGSRVGETFAGRRKGDPLPTHEIIAGERRYRASQLAGTETIPVLITAMTDDKVLELQIVENLQRDDLHPMEEAEGYQRLCDATGITKDDIGAKIGKSRSYVYQRIKLLDLAQAARDAFVEDKIDMSRALIIARCPDTKLQLKALAECTREDYRGDSMSVRAFQAWAQQNIMLRLDSARFDTTNAALVPECGSCIDCTKRTNAAPDLFADVDSADMCIDPQCFHDKVAAHDEVAIEQAKRAGRKVIPIEKAEKIFEPYSSNRFKGYMELDRHPDYSLGLDASNLRKALGKHCPPPVLVMDPKGGGLVEVVAVDQVKKAIKENGLSRTAKVAKKAAAKQEELPVEERKAYTERWQREALHQADAHFKGWTGEIPPGLLRSYLTYMFELADEGPFGPALDLGTEFNTAEAINRLQSLPDSAMAEVFVRWMLHDTENGYPSAWTTDQRNRAEPRHPTWEILKMADVDVDAVQSEAKRAIEGEDRVAIMEAEAKKKKKGERTRASSPTTSPATAKARSEKKSTAQPAAQRKHARKPTGEEVQAQIAEQLQALEGEQSKAPDGAEPEEGAAVAAGGNDLAPAGANEEEGAALAAPPTAQVGDRVRVTDEETRFAGQEGAVTRVLSSGKLKIALDDQSQATLPRSAVEILSTSLWPFPTVGGTGIGATPEVPA